MTAVMRGRDDGSMAWIDSQDNSRQLLRIGGSVGGVAWGGQHILRKPLGVLDTAGGVLSVLNPFSRQLLITRLVVNLTTASTGAGTADFGVAATSISNDTLIDGLDMNAAVGIFDNIKNKGSNGLSSVYWGATGYVTGSMASGAMAGLAGYAYIHFIDP